MISKIGMQFKKPSGFLGKLISNLMIKGNRPSYDRLINDLKIQTYDKILEIGYGPGIGVNIISEKFGQCDIYGVDFSELMFKRATKRNKHFIDKGKVRLLFGDFIVTDVITKDFDKIFCLNVVYFWDDLQQPFSKIKSLLKTEGIFCFYMADKDDLAKMRFTKDGIFNKYAIEHIIETLKLVGFKEIEYYFNKGYFIKAAKC